MKRALIVAAALWCWTSVAFANIVCNLPINLQNGTTADATQVMANFNTLANCFTSAAAAGTNNDITALTALTTPINPSQGGSTIYYGGPSTGTPNAQVVSTLTPSGFTLAFPKTVKFIAGFTNTGPTQLNVGGTGLINIFRYTTLGPVALTGSEIVAGNLIVANYDGTQWILLTNANPPLSATFIQNYLSRLTLSAAGGTGTFGIAAGVATDSTNAALMLLTSAFTKTTASWSVGTGNGALDTGSIAINTWYTVFLMERPDTGAVDICFSVTTTACTTGGAIPAAYTLFRRIGSMKTDASSNWVAFSQNGNEFLWLLPFGDVNTAAQNTTAILSTLTVPIGVKVNALFRLEFSCSVVSASLIVTSPDETDRAPVATPGDANIVELVSNIGTAQGNNNIRTNTSAQIRSRSSTGPCTFQVATNGWIDLRGQQ